VRVPENADSAVALYRRALELDPANVDALVGICATHVYQVLNLYWQGDRSGRLDEAGALITRAIALAPDHMGVLKARAALLRARGRFTEAVAATRMVIARNPGEPTAYRELGLSKLYLGETEEAVEWFRRADRIAPSDLVRWTWLQGLGRALIQLGHDMEAVDALRLAMDSNPGFVRGRAFLASAEALAGNTDLARQLMGEYLQADPGMTIRRFAAERSSVPVDTVNANYLRESERISEGLRRAGMPEE
jgi:tetratricopeptide (TPR) repeat protein